MVSYTIYKVDILACYYGSMILGFEKFRRWVVFYVIRKLPLQIIKVLQYKI